MHLHFLFSTLFVSFDLLSIFVLPFSFTLYLLFLTFFFMDYHCHYIHRKEVQAILHSSIFRIISLSYFSLSIPTMMFAMFSVYVSLDENNILTAKKVFTTLSLLATVRLVSLVFLVKAVVQLSEGRVALKRISVSTCIHKYTYRIGAT